ncbi:MULTISPECIES: twin-arginine translocase subunit TatC [unclassified Pseudodesulfovibrio]|uniref:twin-arginine translocase subunit TatC n=1 Tax=unclassified Pseudodesulfovibrio TaxID=2661612 RepID=UPI000FEBA79F|nr:MULTISPECIES: twin-arginine translocase subunit TatC [unclassified Pseudodesulfovibrio]MCJ2162957.1 twin-arginine translocase subunit TatC [Pseudodesulfovibrio sp. S3-i]RWU06956.1 twin-arginine translocase subunit TatC [Pseudodesulfovibrio sp. S3]
MSSEKDDVKAPEEELVEETPVDPTDDPGADPELYDQGVPVVPEAVEEHEEPLTGGGGGDNSTPGGDGTASGDPESSEETDEEESQEKEEEGHMSLLDHLGELRIRLTRSFIAIAIGMVACYSFAEQMFNILMEPMLKVFQQQAAKNPMLTPGFYEDLGRALGAVLAEKGFQHTEQLPLFMEGLQKSLMQLAQEGHFQYTYPAEAFFSHILISIVAGLFLVSPYVFAQIWGFIAPGLYEHERKWMIPMAVISALFFTTGALFGYFVVFPFGFEFFAGFATEGIQFTPKLNEYLSFCLKLLFAFGFVFELPLFIFFLARLGMVSSAGLRKKRKYAILIGFVVAAILTPPDPFTQCLMAGPLIILYELGIWVAYFFGKKEKRHLKKQAEEEARVQAEMDAVAAEAGKAEAGAGQK